MTMGWMEAIRFLGLDLMVATVFAVASLDAAACTFRAAWGRIARDAPRRRAHFLLPLERDLCGLRDVGCDGHWCAAAYSRREPLLPDSPLGPLNQGNHSMNKIVLVAALATLALAGCAKKEGPAAEAPSDASVAAGQAVDRAGEAVDAAAVATREAAADAADATQEATANAVDATKEATANAVDATGKAVENAGEKMQDAAKN